MTTPTPTADTGAETPADEAVQPEATDDASQVDQQALEGAQSDDDAAADDGQHDDDQDDNSAEDDDKGKASRQAARYRRELRAEQEAHDATRLQLAMARASFVNDIAERSGVDPDLLNLLNREDGWHINDDGTLNREAIAEACQEARSRFRISSGPRPVRSQGASGAGSTPPTLQEALRSAARGG